MSLHRITLFNTEDSVDLYKLLDIAIKEFSLYMGLYKNNETEKDRETREEKLYKSFKDFRDNFNDAEYRSNRIVKKFDSICHDV